MININSNKKNIIQSLLKGFGLCFISLFLSFYTVTSVNAVEIKAEDIVYGGAAIFSNIAITFENDLTFSENKTTKGGGAIAGFGNVSFYGDGDLNLFNNESLDGGSMYFVSNNNTIFHNTINIQDSVATGKGGGIYFLRDAAISCPSGYQTDADGNCQIVCPAGYELDGFGGCKIICPAGQIPDGYGGCRANCTGGQTWDGSQCVCPAGMNWDGNNCVTCSSGTTWNDSTKTCESVCGANASWDGASCACVSAGYTPSGDGKSCVAITCPSSQDWTADGCVDKCGAGQTWTGSSCVTCPTHTSWDASLGACACPYGTYYQAYQPPICTNVIPAYGGDTAFCGAWSPEVPSGCYSCSNLYYGSAVHNGCDYTYCSGVWPGVVCGTAFVSRIP